MKTRIVGGVIVLALGLFAAQITHAQGTMTFVSNLGQASSGAVSIGSDSWLAADFITGNNPGGYALNSIQLAMSDSSGNPSGFTVMIYSGADIGGAIRPAGSLGALTGSANPATAGTYTYTPASSINLFSGLDYFVVVMAGTTIANGAYDWSVTGAASPGFTSSHWGGETSFLDSSDGLNWSFTSANFGQFAINATPAPEPGVIGLFALGGLLVAFQRHKAKSI